MKKVWKHMPPILYDGPRYHLNVSPRCDFWGGQHQRCAKNATQLVRFDVFVDDDGSISGPKQRYACPAHASLTLGKVGPLP